MHTIKHSIWSPWKTCLPWWHIMCVKLCTKCMMPKHTSAKSQWHVHTSQFHDMGDNALMPHWCDGHGQQCRPHWCDGRNLLKNQFCLLAVQEPILKVRFWSAFTIFPLRFFTQYLQSKRWLFLFNSNPWVWRNSHIDVVICMCTHACLLWCFFDEFLFSSHTNAQNFHKLCVLWQRCKKPLYFGIFIYFYTFISIYL